MNALKALMRVRLASFRQMYLGKNKTKDGKENRKTVLFRMTVTNCCIFFWTNA